MHRLMIAPFSLSNILTVAIAVMCLWTIVPQSRGGVVKLWRLALPPCLAAAQALVLLAAVFDATTAHDAEWLTGLILGGLIGRMRGWALALQTDQMWGLVRLQPTFDGVVAAFGLVVFAMIDSVGAALEDPVVAPEYVAAGAALCAGYIGFRAIATAVRATRAPHVELHNA
jgi:hypothetical protein